MNRLPSGTVTFLFTDIEGSTKLAQENPEHWETMRERHHAILQSAMDAHNGYVFQIIGDAFCVAFSTAKDGLNAAIDSQRNLQLEDWGNTPIKVRMGIHTGEAKLQTAGDYRGYLAMSRVQRLMSAGHGGQVLLSLATEELIRDDLPASVSLRDLGEQRLKDLIRPEHIYQLVIPGLPVEFPPLKTLEAYRHNLPVQRTSFIGREKEMGEIKRSILTHKLVTLTGAGGTGKTRLSLQMAVDLLEHFPDGVWFVELAPLSDSDPIPQAILSALDIPEQPSLTVLQQLLDSLEAKRLLLILDNCEHIIQACAKLVDTLLGIRSNLTILATSREALAVPGEKMWHVPSLSLPDARRLPAIEQLSQYEAVRLFIERVMLVQPHFAVTNENAPAVAQICFRLDGIPLAIELAAARVSALSVDHIAARLDDCFRLLTTGSRTSLERHQTLRATIDWSYNLLSEQEKVLFGRLSVFNGGWTLGAAEQICVQESGGFDALDLLTRLVEKSLVILDGSRYHILETTRQYAREKLFESGERESLHDKHLAYFLDLAEVADKEIHGSNQLKWLDRLEEEHDNYRAALNWCIPHQKMEAALRLLGALYWSWVFHGHFSETKSWFDKIRSLPEVTNYPAPYARVLNQIADRDHSMGNSDYAQSLLEESQAIWTKLGVDGERGLAESLRLLGKIAFFDNEDIKTGQSLFQQSLELYQKHGDQWGMAMVMDNLAYLVSTQGYHAKAEELIMKSLAKFQELGDKLGIGSVLNSVGELARFQGEYERAGMFYQQSLEFFRELRGASEVPLINLAWVSLHAGDYSKAKSAFEEILELSKQDNYNLRVTQCLAGLGCILGMTGKHEEAAQLLGAVEPLLASFRSTGHMDPSDQKDYDHYVAAVRAQMDQDTFAKAWAVGRTMTMEQAITFALKETNE